MAILRTHLLLVVLAGVSSAATTYAFVIPIARQPASTRQRRTTTLPQAVNPTSPHAPVAAETATVVPPPAGRRDFLASAVACVTAAACLASNVSPATAAAPAVTMTRATCDATVSVWQRGDRLVYLLGTAHISQLSADLAGRVVRDTHPGAVFVELDLRRVGGGSAATNGIVSSQLDVTPGTPMNKVIIPNIVPVSERGLAATSSTLATTTEGTTAPPAATANKPSWFTRTLTDMGAALVGKAIRGLYANLGDAGFSPGDEFVTAIREGQALQSDIVLGDQDVQITLRRLSQALAATDLTALTNPDSDLERTMAELFGDSNGGQSMASVADKSPKEAKEELTAYVEAMKSRASVRKIMAELKTAAPALVQVMLTERDAYMAAGIDSLNQYAIVTAVMGIAHQDGVEANLQANGWKAVVLQCPVRTP